MLLALVRPAILVALLLGSAGTARADAVDTIVRAEMQRLHIPGVSIAVVRGGRIIKEQGYGLANVELGVPVTRQTVFQSASLGKQFAAALVMVLVQDGTLALDAPIASYLADAPPAWAGITLRQLLNHTSGLPDSDPAIDLRRDYTEDELLQSAYRVPLAATPGASWAYSNLGYQVVGVLLSRVGGKFYGDQLRERLFAPLGMATTVISERNLVPHLASGYDWIDGVLMHPGWVAPSQNTTADGSLHVTAHDLALWSISLDGARLLSAASRGAMWTPARKNDGSTFDYGLGWILETVGGHRIVRHDGEWQGFSNHLLRFVNEPFAVIVLTNRSHAEPHVMVDLIAAHYFPELQPHGSH